MSSIKLSDTASITFFGGTGTVTGANFLLELTGAMSQKILVDCGLFQGSRVADERNRAPFPYDPKAIDALFITHAHLDHIGRIPSLVRAGFRGVIYSTPPTKDIADLSLIDSLGVLTKESTHNQLPPLYEEADVRAALALWKTVDYHQVLTLGQTTVVAKNAGHILGSAMYEFTWEGKKIVFTGDLGNSPVSLIREGEVLTDANYLVMESVYGDRNHETETETQNKLEEVIENTMRAGGTLMIPAFSIERTQEVLHAIQKMMVQSRIPVVPVFLDSPLAIAVTKVYKKYHAYLKSEVTGEQKTNGELFQFPQLQRCLTSDESKLIARHPERKIIIAGSGMSNGGRILHHEKRYLPDPRSTLLLVGYQVPGSLGRILQEGAKQVTIHGETVPVRAKVVTLSGYSAHRGSDDLLAFVEPTADSLKKVFVVMGEPHSSLFLVQRLRDYLALDAVSPQADEKFMLQ
jgi:metallo-beta-lactamase family protein